MYIIAALLICFVFKIQLSHLVLLANRKLNRMKEPTFFKKKRLDMHLTQLELALRMDISRGALINLEDGKTHVLTESVLRFCDATDTPLIEIIAACYPDYCEELFDNEGFKDRLKQTVDEYETRLQHKNEEISRQKERIEVLRQTIDLQRQMIGMYEQGSGEK